MQEIDRGGRLKAAACGGDEERAVAEKVSGRWSIRPDRFGGSRMNDVLGQQFSDSQIGRAHV